MAKPWKLAPALLFLALSGLAQTEPADERRFIHVAAKDASERSAIADAGMSIEAVRSDGVWGFANPDEIKEIQKSGFEILGNYDFQVGRGGHESSFGTFPGNDSAYHTYAQLTDELQKIQASNPDIASLVSIGKTVEGRDIWALHLLSPVGSSTKPGVIFMGNHHAREHLSLEVPLKLAHYLMENRRAPQVSRILDTRDIWIIPMVNPDGAEFDISTGKYQYWRKNRRDNRDGTFGVDLNRNYSFQWGTGGSSSSTRSETYKGPEPFSEPETQAIRDFVRARKNVKVLLTFHTYSELVLYPWGHTRNRIPNGKDLAVFQKMAATMAQWNHYTPEQASSLYVASGDTTDWAYGELGIFAFTFEMSPGGWSPGGFYPGPQMINKAFNDNLRPCLYLMQVAGDPYATIESPTARWLPHYFEPKFFSSF